MAVTNTTMISQQVVNDAIQAALKAVAPLVENILRKHIDSDIEGVTIPTATGGPWYFDRRGKWSVLDEWVGQPYSKRNTLSGAVSHRIAGSVLAVSSTASSDPSVITGQTIGGWGNYLEFFEVGNQGFKGSFPRPAVTNAQKEVDSDPTIKATIVSVINSRLSAYGICVTSIS